jgi:hypothetical protein
VKTTNISRSRRMQIQPEYLQFRRVNLSGNLNASKVKIGETVIQLGSIVDMNEESQILHQPNNLKIKRLKTRIRKRAKVMKFSDLPLLASSDLEESFISLKVELIRLKEKLNEPN